MSYIDFDKLNDEQLIAQFVIECRGKGLILPYDEYDIILRWLKQSSSADHLLLVLSEILPAFFEKAQQSGRTRSLKSAEKRVLKKLQEFRMVSA